MQTISQRDIDILSLLISQYIATAMPVASGTIANLSSSGLSSASIRNILAKLESMGFLTHPHTSAGRFPTKEGLRFYVRAVLKKRELSGQEKMAITAQFSSLEKDIDDVLKRAGKILSLMSNYIGLVVLRDELLVEGESKLLDAPEFSDVKKLKCVMQALEEKRSIVGLLSRAMEADNVCVYIGEESDYEPVSDCGIVTASYKKRGAVMGTLGVIGPARMDYSKVIPSVDFTAKLVGDLLDS